MIDLLVKSNQSPQQIKSFFAKIFECKVDQIKVFSLDEFNLLNEEIDSGDLQCICVYSDTKGDASQLLQLYKYKVDDVKILERIIHMSTQLKEIFYIPNNSFNEWLMIGAFDRPKTVRQVEHEEENCFYFE